MTTSRSKPASPHSKTTRQLSPVRSWEFDALVVVLFDDDFNVWRVARIPTEPVRASSRYNEHVRGWFVTANDKLLDAGEDWTQQIQAVVQ